MATAARHLDSTATPSPGTPTPVIADDGVRAWVVVQRFSHQPEVGDRFQFRGRIWEIVRPSDRVRGYVAHPVGPRPCAF
ncbi:MAG: hypothetical protein ACOY3Y_04670 [Acidobacteriota bacterium]